MTPPLGVAALLAHIETLERQSTIIQAAADHKMKYVRQDIERYTERLAKLRAASRAKK